MKSDRRLLMAYPLAQTDSFEAIAREWIDKFAHRWIEEHVGRIRNRFEQNVFPWIGSKPIRTITAPRCIRVPTQSGAKRMKMREVHIVPLSSQAVAILREVEPLTGPTGYVFPSERSFGRSMSENTI